jgi:hypothetical protein
MWAAAFWVGARRPTTNLHQQNRAPVAENDRGSETEERASMSQQQGTAPVTRKTEFTRANVHLRLTAAIDSLHDGASTADLMAACLDELGVILTDEALHRLRDGYPLSAQHFIDAATGITAVTA